MYVQRNTFKSPSGKEYRTTLLCESHREGKKVRKKTLLNLSCLPEEVILSVENTLKSKTETVVKEKDIFVENCFDFGYVFVIEQLMKRLRINETLDNTLPEATAKLVKAMIIGKLVTKGSKLAIFNWLEREEELSKRFELDMKNHRLDDFYAGLSVLNSHKDKLDKKWFRYQKTSGNCVYLYDITSVYFEGTENELSAFGYSRDGKKGKMQICVGLVTDADGNPLRIEVFKGNTVDSQTVEEQILKLKKDFGAETIIFVGDGSTLLTNRRGMRIKYNIDNSEELQNIGLQFITGLTKNEIKGLISGNIIQLSLFSHDLVEVETDEGERFVLSINPDLEYVQQQYLDTQKEKTLQKLKEIKNSWNLRRLQNRDNELKIKNKETKNKNLKTKFTTKDTDRYKKQVNHALEQYKTQQP
jgi:transposase